MFQLVAMNIYQSQSLRSVPWNQLKSENTETLYLLSAMKEAVQIDSKKARKHALLWNKHKSLLVHKIFIVNVVSMHLSATW